VTTLKLGVVDVAYTGEDGQQTTTGDVATFLESDYHVIEVFYQLYEEKIKDFLVDAMAGEIESMAQGKPVSVFGGNLETKLEDRSISGVSVNGKIEEAFRDYLDMREWQQISGQTVAAALLGISSRKKKQATGKSRPEFIDTGLYQASFRAWIAS